MSNYAGMARGDYYRGDYYRGDPGLFGSIGKFLGKAAGAVLSVAPGPVGIIGRKVVKAIQGGPSRAAVPPRIHLQPPPLPQRFGPQDIGPSPYGGQPGIQLAGRRRRMNPMNVKALRRASRRIDGFARTARRALKHTPFVLVSRASRGGRGGSPGVITRAEAARALRR